MPERSIFVRLAVRDADKAIAELQKVGIRGEKALTRIERASKPASRGLVALDRASGEVRGRIQGLAASAGPLGSVVGALGPAGLAAAAGIGALTLGLRSALRATREALTELDAIGKAADKIGVTTDFLQELRFAGELSGLSIRDVDDALTRLQRRAGLFATDGGGPAAKAFQTLKLDVEAAGGAMKDTETIFEEAVKALEGVENQAQRSALASQLFGEDAGPKLVVLLNQGSEGIARMRQEARELGIVLDERLIREAEKTNDQLTIMQRVVDANLNSALVELAPVLVGIAEAAAFAARAVADLVDVFRDLEEKTTRGLENRLATLRQELAEAESGATVVSRFLGLVREPEEVRADIARVEGILEARRARRPRPGGGALAPGSTGGESASSAKSQEDAIERLRQANERLVETLRFEQVQLTKTARQRAIDAELRKLNAEATAAERAEVARLAGDLFDNEQRLKVKAEADREAQKIAEEGARVTEAVKTATERYNDELARLNELLEAGAITQETFNRAAEQAKEAILETNDALGQVDNFNERAGPLLADNFVEAASGARDLTSALAEVEQGLLDIGNAIIKQQLGGFFTDLLNGDLGTIFENGRSGTGGGSGGGGSGGLGILESIGGFIASIFERGGTAGGPAPARTVPATAFVGAPRYQAGTLPGLAADEVAAILHRGEIVLNQAQSAAVRRETARGSSGGLSIGRLEISVAGEAAGDPQFAGEQIANAFLNRVDTLMRQR